MVSPVNFCVFEILKSVDSHPITSVWRARRCALVMDEGKFGFCPISGRSRPTIMSTVSIPQPVLGEFSQFLDVPVTQLESCVGWLTAGDAYREWKMPKGNGRGFRPITAPREELKHVQRRILALILYSVTIHNAAHGFVRERDILTNARAHQHTQPQTVYGVDLESAFPSVSEERVRAVLRRPIQRLLNAQVPGRVPGERVSQVVEALVTLCCHKGCLPQGSPTSPALLNIVLLSLDQQLAAIAQRFGLVYTRYADDLTFSTPAAQLTRAFVDDLHAALQQTGWNLNPQKTAYLRRSCGRELEVTGIVLQPGGRFTVPRRRLTAYEELFTQFLDGDEFSDQDRAVATGITVYVSRVYGGFLPRTLGHLWGRTKQKFGIPEPQSRARHDMNMYMPDVPYKFVSRRRRKGVKCFL